MSFDVVVPDEFRHLYEPRPGVEILKVPHPALRRVAEPVAELDDELQKLIDRMIEQMRLCRGIGLAAPQLGVPTRLIVVAPQGTAQTAMINPEIVFSEGESVGEEGCLSIPGLYGDVTRRDSVHVRAIDRTGRNVLYELHELPARIAQHEIDHLDGVLFIDKVDPATLHWRTPDAEVEDD